MLNPIKFLIILTALSASQLLLATSTTSEQAADVVKNWLLQTYKPLDDHISSDISNTISYRGTNGELLYHIVSMKPEGYVIVAGDDQVEPIIGFTAQGHYDDTEENFITALVKKDLSNRISYVRNRPQAAPAISSDGTIVESQEELSIKTAQNKWSKLKTDPAASNYRKSSSMTGIADVRVGPLLNTKWGQATEGNKNICFNYYTPHNLQAGCTATAFAQVMYYFKHDATLPGHNFGYQVDFDGAGLKTHYAPLMGGDGHGGHYDWSLMQDGPYINNEISRQAIGRLLRDAGVAIGMKYYKDVSGGSVHKTADALRNTFGFSNSMVANVGGGANLRNNVIIPNLDAGIPMVVSLSMHSVVFDGYGFDSGTMYTHVNLGYNGSTANIWYTLPDVRVYSVVVAIVYNTYTTGHGEIVSGRVVDSNNVPIANIQVTATKSGGGTYTATTSSKGIYALTKLPSNATYAVTAAKAGLNFTTHQVSVAESVSNTSKVGNRWGINFRGTTGSVANTPPMAFAHKDENIVLGSSIVLSNSGVDDDGVIASSEWSENSTVLSLGHTFTYKPTTLGTHTLTFKVTDDDGASAYTTINIEVTQNMAPTADAKGDKSTERNVRIHITASGNDPDGKISAYRWVHNGQLMSSSQNLFYASNIPGEKIFILRVTDNSGATAEDTITITVTDPKSTNKFPNVNAGEDKTVVIGESVTLRGSAIDSDGSIRKYEWSEGTGIIAKTATLVYVPTSLGVKKLYLHAQDNNYAYAGDMAIVTVVEATTPVNTPPVADAGEDKTVVQGVNTTITGSGSDSDGNIASYLWKQGTSVLGSTASITHSFANPGTKTLTLTVMDNNGATHSDTMLVTVTSSPQSGKKDITPVIMYLLQ